MIPDEFRALLVCVRVVIARAQEAVTSPWSWASVDLDDRTEHIVTKLVGTADQYGGYSYDREDIYY